MYDAFETPRAVRGDLPLLDRAQALDYLAEVRERALQVLAAARHRRRRARSSSCSATSSSTTRRCCRRSSCAPAAGARASPRPAPGRARRPHAASRPSRSPAALHARRRPLRLRLRQRAPAPPRRAARVPDRPHAGHQRHLADLRRGRRLRAPRVVERRGLVLEGGLRHHPPGRLGPRARRGGGSGGSTAGRRWTPTSPWSTCPGSRPMPSPERTAPASRRRRSGRRQRPGTRTRDAARRYPWGDEPPCPRRANLDQTGFGPHPAGAHPEGASPCGALGMLGDVWEWTASDVPRLRRLRRPPVPRVLRGLLRPRLPGAARRLVGQPRARVDHADVAQLGPPAAAPDLLGSAARLGRLGLPTVAAERRRPPDQLPGAPARRAGPRRPTARRSARSTACSTTRASTSSTGS